MKMLYISYRHAVVAAIIASVMGIFNACHRHGHGAAENHMHRHNFDELVKMMVEHDLRWEASKAGLPVPS